MAGSAAGATGESGTAGPSRIGRVVSTTRIAWEASHELDVREWLMAGKRLGSVTRSCQWWLGDWIRYGNGRWGEKYKEAARITGYDVQSLRNFAYVAGAVDVSRRRDDLTWSHHAEIAGVEPAEQDRWLVMAADQRMSVADLRIEFRACRRQEEGHTEAESPTRKMITCPYCDNSFPQPES